MNEIDSKRLPSVPYKLLFQALIRSQIKLTSGSSILHFGGGPVPRFGSMLDPDGLRMRYFSQNNALKEP